jgi:hypothetical protein
MSPRYWTCPRGCGGRYGEFFWTRDLDGKPWKVGT